MPKTYNTEIDFKCTIWERQKLTITAESEKDVIKIAQQIYYLQTPLANVINEDSKLIQSSLEPITVKENTAMSECDQLIPEDNWETIYKTPKVVNIINITENE